MTPAGAGGGKAGIDRYRGCLLGLAVGDALGAPVEFVRWDEITSRHGEHGIRGYVPGPWGCGAVTDDTQMALATARGILAAAPAVLSGELASVVDSVYRAYLVWLATQDDPRQRRAPGTTCLSALRSGRMGTPEQPINGSKGCGGVMRVAPVALALPGEPDRAFDLGARTAAVTHGHPAGYLSAGFLAAVLSRLLAGQGLEEAVAAEAGRRDLDGDTRRLVLRALDLARSGPDLRAVLAEIGEGWTGDEAVAIAVLCALRFPDSFEEGVLAAVNRSGDSDSTGSVAGAIFGAWLGERSIPRGWLLELEVRREVGEVADRMWQLFGCGGRTA